MRETIEIDDFKYQHLNDIFLILYKQYHAQLVYYQ